VTCMFLLVPLMGHSESLISSILRSVWFDEELLIMDENWNRSLRNRNYIQLPMLDLRGVPGEMCDF
jgi:hypothetical protein